MADKLRAYKSVPTIQDILSEPGKLYVLHHQRRDGQWQVGVDLSEPEAEIIIERWNVRIRLEDVYKKAFIYEAEMILPATSPRMRHLTWSAWRRTGSAFPVSFPADSSSASRSPAPWPSRLNVLLLDEPLAALDAQLRH